MRERPLSQNPPPGGVLNVYKPRGWSSFHVVGLLRRLTGIKRIGHAGTLDPFAEGVLPMLIGRSTRLLTYMDEDLKTYRVVLVPGADTVTQDLVGEVTRVEPMTAERVAALCAHDYALIRSELRRIEGTSEQLAPLYSAVKVGGRPLYDYARKGEEPPERPLREITVHEARLTEVWVAEEPTVGLSDEQLQGIEALLAAEAPGGKRGKPGRLDLAVSPELPRPVMALAIDFAVSKGTYIRTLCATLGERWGTGAYAYRLQRLAVRDMRSQAAALPEALEAAQAAEGAAGGEGEPDFAPWMEPWWLGPEAAVASLPVLELEHLEATRLTQGQRLSWKQVPPRVARLLPASGAQSAAHESLAAATTGGRLIGTVRLQRLSQFPESERDPVICVTERMICTSEDLPC